MITFGEVTSIKNEIEKEKEELTNAIKYQIERITELKRILREAEDAKEELFITEGKLRICMAKYIRL